MLDVAELDTLFSKLCVGLGFCLPPENENRLRRNPPDNVDDFTNAVFLAEGLNPEFADRHLYRCVRDVISEAFQKHYNSLLIKNEL